MVHAFIRCSTMPQSIDSCIIDALSRVCLRQEYDRIDKRLAALLGSADSIPPTDWEYKQIEQQIEELKTWQKKNLALLRLKNERIGSLLHWLWVNRVRTSCRSTAGQAYIPMNLTMPVPPTNETANSILIRGRVANGSVC